MKILERLSEAIKAEMATWVVNVPLKEASKREIGFNPKATLKGVSVDPSAMDGIAKESEGNKVSVGGGYTEC